MTEKSLKNCIFWRTKKTAYEKMHFLGCILSLFFSFWCVSSKHRVILQLIFAHSGKKCMDLQRIINSF